MPIETNESEETAAESEAVEDYRLRWQRPSPVEYPSLVPDVDPIGGRIRVEAEDFRVTEIPLYRPCGHGEHSYITIVKTNRTTLQARQYLAKTLGVHEEAVGFAGFKDRRAVAEQTFSVPGIDEGEIRRLDRPWLRVVNVARHTNKLRTGHLSGNHFDLLIRDVREGAAETVSRILERVRKTGLPNFFGPQRFGFYGDSYRIGGALLHRDPKSAVEIFLGSRDESDDDYRRLFDAGKYQQAIDALPPGCRSEAAVLHALRRYPGNFRAAARRMPHQMKRMYFSAFQAFLFNWALRERMTWRDAAFAEPLEGDFAFIHASGASFIVRDLDEARERAAAGEISPSGPVFGRRMSFAEGREGAMEHAILAAEKLRPQSFLSHVKGLKLNGSRRPYRIPLKEVHCEVDDTARTVRLAFTLPPGSYATMLLEQLMGAEAAQGEVLERRRERRENMARESSDPEEN